MSQLGAATAIRQSAVTNGLLPAAPFAHSEPTAVGVIELERELAVERPSRTALTSSRDGLLLVRLHGDPLGVIHVDADLPALSAPQLAAEIRSKLRDELREHCRRFGCATAIGTVEQLISTVRGGTGLCPGETPQASGLRVSVIVPTSARPAQLERCLRALADLRDEPFEVIVVDNCPQVPGARQAVEALDGRLGVRYVAEPRPGSSVARNRGIREASGDIVAFLDDDVVVDRDWLRWLIEPFEDPQVTATTGLVLPLELATAAQKQFELYAGFSKGVRKRHYNMTGHRAGQRALYPYWGGLFGSGCSMAFRRAALIANGGFDPALGAGSIARAGADIEAFTATILSGGELVYQPRSVCWHEHRREGSQLREQLFNYGVGFTAILTKHLTRDPRFLPALLRTMAQTVRRRSRSKLEPRRAAVPADLRMLERRGMLRGPLLYAFSARSARRLGLYDVLSGD